MTLRPFFSRALLAAGFIYASSASTLAASDYPQHNVRFVVPFAPGGIVDLLGRVVAQGLSEKWGTPVIVENRGGGGGNIGAVHVAHADADGYTVLVTSSSFTVNLTLNAKPGYAFSDFTTAGIVATSANIIIAAPNLPYKTLPEVIAAAQTHNLSFGSAGIGTTPHLTGEQIFHVSAKADIRHGPFTGAGPAVTATMGGQVPVSVVALPSAYEQVKAGLVKGLAVTTPQRLPDLPDVPTVKETGIGDIETSTMVAFFMPARTPAAIAAKFNADLNALIDSGALDKALATAGATPVHFDEAQAHAYVESEISKWADIIRSADIKAD